MINNTDNKDHWILDREYSDKGESSVHDKVILDALNSQISKRTESLFKSDTFFVNNTDSVFNLPNLFNKNAPKYKNYISKSQNWIGHVVRISKEDFLAKLIDKNDPSTFEVAQFDIDEVSNGDLDLLKIGALFYWSVGFANQNGQVIKQSLIRFKRVVEISNEEFDSIIDNINELDKTLKWE